MTLKTIERVRGGWGTIQEQTVTPEQAAAAKAAHQARLAKSRTGRAFHAYKPGEWAYYRCYGTLTELHQAGMEPA